MRALDYGTFDRIAKHVHEECSKRGIVGAFAAVDLRSATDIRGIYYCLIRLESPLRLGRPGKEDSNVLAIALAKLAMVIGHRRNTGIDEPLKGEVAWKGGRISEDQTHGYAFSGGTEEQDDEIMQLAETFHKSISMG